MNVGYFVDKNNHVYEYAKGNLESNYTSLDMSKVESKPTYESLVNVQSNMVKFSIFLFNLNFVVAETYWRFWWWEFFWNEVFLIL
jgi:hypothetical protein